MKKVLILLVVLVTVPAMAASNVAITTSNNGDCTATISYITDANLIRGFGLDLTVDSGQTIDSIAVLDSDYRIYPGQIVIVDGNVTDYNTPYAPGTLGSGAVTVELASLYTEDANYSGDPNYGFGMQPGQSGTLLTVTVSGDCTLSIAENAARAGIVMENPDESPNVTITGIAITCCSYPACWDYPTQCHGDADGSGTVNTADWPHFRDGFLKVYPDPAYQPCGDYDRDGDIDTADWPEFRDWFLKSPPADCPPGDLNGIYCP